MSFAELLAIEVLEQSEGRARLQAVVGADHLNLHGSAHGGFLYTLADEAFALASNSREARAVALSVHMDYFSMVRPGDVLEAVASEEHLGRRVATYRVELRRKRGDHSNEAAGDNAASDKAAGDNADSDNAAGDNAAGEAAEAAEVVALFTGTVYRMDSKS